MNDIEVLVLHGSPGSGKTTLARAVAEYLRAGGVPHAVIDLDDISAVHPRPPRSFAYDNLAAMWPNYAAIPGLKVLIPSVVADRADLDRLYAAMPGARLVVCELTAPVPVLTERVTAREPNGYWRARLRDFVDLYHRSGDRREPPDFAVSTYERSVDDAVREIVAKAGWG